MTGASKIAFQGELGANSHEACRSHFPDLDWWVSNSDTRW